MNWFISSKAKVLLRPVRINPPCDNVKLAAPVLAAFSKAVFVTHVSVAKSYSQVELSNAPVALWPVEI